MSDTGARAVSEILEGFRAVEKEQLTLRELVDVFAEGGLALLLIVFAMPMALPLPALGIAQVMALPLLFLSAQLAMGRHTLWLPEKMGRKQIARKNLIKAIDIAQPWLKRIEFFLRPRLRVLSSQAGYHLMGIMCVCCSISVAMPVPFSNTVPSMGIVLMGLGLLERDGIVQIAGIAVGALGILIAITIYVVGIEAVRALVGI